VIALYELISAGQPIGSASIDPLTYQTSQASTAASRGEAIIRTGIARNSFG
jgi:hypothetical protein